MQEGLVRVMNLVKFWAVPILFLVTAMDVLANTPPPVYYTTDPGYVPALFTSIIATVLWFVTVCGSVIWACRKRDLLGCGQVFAFLTILFVGTLILIAGGCTQFRAPPTQQEDARSDQTYGGLKRFESGRLNNGPSKATSEPALIILILVWGGICFSPYILSWLLAKPRGKPDPVLAEVTPTAQLVEDAIEDEPPLPPNVDQPGSGSV